MTCWRSGRVIRSRGGRADLYMPNIGPMELVIVLVIALVVLGPKRLPDAGKAVGKGMREFKESLSGNSKDDDLDVDYEPGSIARSSSARTTCAADSSALSSVVASRTSACSGGSYGESMPVKFARSPARAFA